MSDVGYQAKAKRSSEIAVYKNYGNLFSPARNATHSAAGGSQIVKSVHCCSRGRGSFLGNTSSLLKNVRFFPDSPPDLISPRVQGWSVPKIISRTIARRGNEEGVSLTNSLM